MKTIINTKKAPEPIGPYNQAIKLDNVLYVSGQIAIEPTWGELITQDIEVETHQVMANLGAILEAADMTFSDVVKCSIFVKNLDDFAKVNEIYGSYFKGDYPSRECVEVARLPKNVNVEISCIASL